jgi:ribosomal protein L34E
MKRRANKTLNCKICGDEVHSVGSEATAVTCWRCVSDSLKGTILEDSITNKNEDNE